MYLLPSSSQIYAPLAFLINGGVPPTDLKARTGELTPPGISVFAFWNNFSDFSNAFLLRLKIKKWKFVNCFYFYYLFKSLAASFAK